MPAVLWKHLSWATFGVAPLITLLLAGIDNIGIQIENPMRILPMVRQFSLSDTSEAASVGIL
jgi:ion channel-forming bestrophin family protein